MPKIFKIIQEKSRLTDDDMLKTFNCGLGMIIIDKKDELKVHNTQKNGFRSYTIGKIIKRMKIKVSVMTKCAIFLSEKGSIL